MTKTAIETPVAVLALLVTDAHNQGCRAAQSATLTDVARADNVFRSYLDEVRRERGSSIYRALVGAYVEGKRVGTDAWKAVQA